MKNFLLVFLTISAFTVCGFSQTVLNSAPVKWEYYKNSKDKLSIMFPKLPVKLFSADRCKQKNVTVYYAYADETVYEFKVHEKSKDKIPAYCKSKEKFTKESFSNYLNEIQSAFVNMQNINRGENQFIKLELENSANVSKWLLNDFKNLRWFEFTVSSRKYRETQENLFIDSLKFTALSKAIEISDGSPIVLGDELTEEQKIEEEKKKQNSLKLSEAEKAGEKITDSKSSPLTIIFKAKPKYTDRARESNTVGDVRLRVTFLPNGAIGSIAPIKGLENGLTDQAIEAARKMAFLPQSKNDWKVAVTKVVVFSFSIY